MNNPGLAKTFIATTLVTKRRIVKIGANDDSMVLAAAATDIMFGISTDIDVAAGAKGDCYVSGIPEVEYGGTVAFGDPLTSDASGRAVKAVPATGVNNRVIGYAMASGVVGDIGSCNLIPSIIQGA